MTVMELPSRSVWWDLNSGQHSQYGQRRRRFLLVCGADAAQDVRAITLFKSLWPTYPSLSVLWSSYEGRTGGQIRCSPSSVWKRSSRSRNAAVHSGEAQTTEQVWEEYFVDPSQWWDNRVEKKNPRAPDFKHKASGKALWVDGWYTPAWVKARLKANPMTQGYQAKDSQGTAQPNRHNGEDGGGSMPMQRASTMNEAITIVKNHLQQGIRVDSYMYVELLKRCLKQTDLKAAKEVHDCIIKSQMEQNVYVANNLLSVYIRCGNLQGARQVFDSLGKKDVVSWNVMIGGYAQRSCAEEAMAVFNQMRQENVQADEITYLSILKACASPLALKWGREVHMHIKHDAFESDVRVGTALLKMYTNCGSIKEARQVFDDLSDRNVISWNVMVGAYAESGCGWEAYELYLQMLQEGFEPDAITYLCILKEASASAGALEWVKEVHRHIREAGFESDLRVGNALVHKYAKSGSVDDARLVFDRMEERDVITWNAMIGAYAESGRGVEAYRLYLRMKGEGFQPDAVTYLSMLNACASAGSFEWVKEVHRHAFKDGLGLNVRVCSALVHMYAKSGNIDEARLVFDRMKERNVITWNTMIGAYAESGRGVEAYEVYLQMKRKGNKPDAVTYVSILNACASAGAFEWVKEVHSHALSEGLESDVRVGSALIHMYAKIGSIDDAQIIFDRMKERNIITWTAIIGAHAESGDGVKAYQLYLEMRREGFQPDAITYASILNACASAGALEWVKDVHSHVQEAGLESDVHVGSALVHMYSKSGSIDDARLVFDRMKDRNVITWTAMIGGLAHHGCGHEALEKLRNMIGDGIKPDEASSVAVLSACSHAGLVDDGRRLFLAMTQDYGIRLNTVLCNCMVDLLGRAGHLEEAMHFIRNMPVEPDGATWGALLGACRTYGNVEMAEIAAKEVLKLEPEGAGPYVLLSNIYAAAGKWEEVSLVRTMMQESGIRKEPGRSWIEVDNRIHHFVVGDASHPETKEIYIELNRLNERIKAEGYIPDTRLVLQNIDEKDKELALCSHSEKLAIVYGLMHTARGKPIRVYKNLRVCSDCHAATKLISKVTGREIVARDANRFHHFKDGVCSCGDYW